MAGMSNGGKGSDTRPRQVSKEHYDSEFDRIFYGKKSEDTEEEVTAKEESDET